MTDSDEVVVFETGQDLKLGRHITIFVGKMEIEEFRELVKKVKRAIGFNKK